MIKDENYYTIQGWMRNRLHLKGNDLHVYAMLYSFSQDGKSEFRGSIAYMADFTGASDRNIHRSLIRLEKYGLIEKTDHNAKTGKTNGFKCVSLEQITGADKMSYPVGQNVIPAPDKTSYPVGQNVIPLPYNNTYNKVGILKEYKEERKKVKEKNNQTVKSHEEIMEEWDVPEPLKIQLRLWLTACYNKGNLILNEVFEDLLGDLFDKYGNDVNAQCKVVRNALESGYVRIVV